LPGRLFVPALLGLALGFVLVPAPARADDPAPRGVDVTGRWGIGTATGDAPLGVRYLWDPRYGFDAGLGFGFFSSGSLDSRVVVEGAFLYALAPADRVNFYFRPGVQFRNEHTDAGSTTTVGLRAFLELEVFVSSSFSVDARTGLFVDSVSPPGDASNRTDWGLDSGLVTEAGFHFYLPAKD